MGKTEFLQACGAEKSGNIYVLTLSTTHGDVTLKLCDGLFTNDIHAAIYMYDITRSESFENVLTLKNHFSRMTSFHDVPALIIGNKLDLLWDRQVQVGDAALYNLPFVEISAKNQVNVRFALLCLTRILIHEPECEINGEFY